MIPAVVNGGRRPPPTASGDLPCRWTFPSQLRPETGPLAQDLSASAPTTAPKTVDTRVLLIGTPISNAPTCMLPNAIVGATTVSFAPSAT